MIDIKKIRNEKEKVEKALSKKMGQCSLDNVILLDDKRKFLQQQIDELQRYRNEKSKEIGRLKSAGVDTSEIIIKMQELGQRISLLSNQLSDIKLKLKEEMESLPNIPDDDILPGGKENNVVIKKSLNQRNFGFDFKDHIELESKLGLIDYNRGIKLSGSGGWVYTGKGAQLEWALINYCINEHLRDGWEFVLVPHMLNYDCGYVAGQFPKFKNEVYWLDDNHDKFLLPTSETALASLHKNEILTLDFLPKKYFAYTPCYRVENGSSRKEERGIIRSHQFNKIEMFQLTKPEESDMFFNEILNKAENLVKNLGLHYQISKLAAGDCSASMCRTYDIEVWIPSMGIYKEVSSVSNCRDYQARRGNIRFKNENGDLEFVNTLNGSGLATSRLLPAILEQFQLKDGSVVIPEVLRPYMGNLEIIEPVQTRKLIK